MDFFKNISASFFPMANEASSEGEMSPKTAEREELESALTQQLSQKAAIGKKLGVDVANRFSKINQNDSFENLNVKGMTFIDAEDTKKNTTLEVLEKNTPSDVTDQEEASPVMTGKSTPSSEEMPWMKEEERAKLISGEVVGTILTNSDLFNTEYQLNFCKLANMESVEKPIAFLWDPEKAKFFLPDCHSVLAEQVERNNEGLITSFRATCKFYQNPKHKSKLLEMQLRCELAPVNGGGYCITFQSHLANFKGAVKATPCDDKVLISYEASLKISNFAYLFLNNEKIDAYKNDASETIKAALEAHIKQTIRVKASDKDREVMNKMAALHEKDVSRNV